ncbi:MAG TPA: hypothetical protein VFV07_12060 [Rhizomicrobium sp.]|nr:hypothetical protein [Rhizomicrobium sp.]
MIKKIVLAASFVLLGTAARAETFNVVVDGTCDTFSLNIQGLMVAGTRNGCSFAVEGGAVARVNHRRGVVVSETMGNIVITWYFTRPHGGAGKVFVSASNGSENIAEPVSTYHLVRSTPASGLSGPDITKNPDFEKLRGHQ